MNVNNVFAVTWPYVPTKGFIVFWPALSFNPPHLLARLLGTPVNCQAMKD